MMELIQNHWAEFLGLALAHIIAVASPGPDFAVVTKHTINYGKKIGRITAIGIGLAILLHVTYALLGFSLLVQTNSNIYNIVMMIGVAFLLYLGFGALTAKPRNYDVVEKEQTNMNYWKAFSIGFLTNALNIKALLFFLYLFTSLVNKESPLPVKLFYGAWLSIYTGMWFYLLASFIGLKPIRSFFTKFGLWFDRAMGIILIGLGIWLLIK